MLKFKDYLYERPDMIKLEEQFHDRLQRFDNADTFEVQDEIIEEINSLRREFESMYELVYIRYSIDTTDKYYENENEYMNEVMPIYEGLVSKYYNSLVGSKFRKLLEKKWGKQLFTLAELKLKTFSPEIISDLQEENKLSSEYTKLMASVKIIFEGEERNLSELEPFMQAKDRDIRKRANEAMTDFFIKNEKKFDDIYDKLVKVRHRIAKKLGYKNFVELGYDRMMRSDYDAEMVANFRNQVLEYIVPVATKLRQRQLKRLGLDSLKYYDEKLEFLSGNAIPKGDTDWVIEKAKIMYQELSPKIDKFFKFMNHHELLELVSKKGKANRGYCTYISKYKSPFIFANFNGTSQDVFVLTHEIGHAFQIYFSRHSEIPEYQLPTCEASEINANSMEFLTWPWVNLFFEEEEKKYKFSHLCRPLLVMPYIVLVDEFQHWVYENPQATPEERKNVWREMEKKYLPHRDYEDNDFLNRGGFWFKQGHIFRTPFYYIDYALAFACALQLWIKSRENREEAWNAYMRLCEAGGSKSFLELVNLANLRSPFEDGCIKSVIGPIKEWLNNIDDKNL